ncbi:hypothetical protein ACQP3D_29810, partial [Escherichia coli]
EKRKEQFTHIDMNEWQTIYPERIQTRKNIYSLYHSSSIKLENEGGLCKLEGWLPSWRNEIGK